MKAIAELEKVRAEWIADKAKLEQGIADLDRTIAMLKARADADPQPSAPKKRKLRAAKPTNGGNGHAEPVSPDGDIIKDVILDALKEAGPAGMLSAKLRGEAGVEPTRFKTAINALIIAGKIKKQGEKAGTSYVLVGAP